MAELERLILPAPRHVRKRHRVQRQQDAWQKAVSQSVLRAALLQRVAPLQVLLARLQAQTDESELLRAQPLRVRLVSRLEAPLRVHEPAPCVALEQRPRVLPARSALSPAQRKPQVHSVSRRLASGSLAEARQAWQVSSARPSQPGIELECVFFSVTPYPGKRSIMALALTSSSRASSLIRT